MQLVDADPYVWLRDLLERQPECLNVFLAPCQYPERRAKIEVRTSGGSAFRLDIQQRIG